MRHPGPFQAEAEIEVTAEPGASAALDRAAAEAGSHAFLRAAWFGAPEDVGLTTLAARRRGVGEVVAALPLAARRVGPFRLSEVAGSYWPYRSFPVSAAASVEELAALLGAREGRSLLGRAWRLGPILADDPVLARLRSAAGLSGWTLIARPLGTVYVLDLAALAEPGPWPSSKTLRKNRWLERRLGEAGALEFRTVTGGDWTKDTFAILSQIEQESWVGRDADPSDTKFMHTGNRRAWERAVGDPQIAAMLFASLLFVGGRPAAFNFGLRCGERLHMIANSYSERFREGSPGRILLYHDFRLAAEAGTRRVYWGAGDPGYKTEMGARPGPGILDCLFVRGGLAATLARWFWARRTLGP